jgi:WD40 repeat protein
MAVSGSNIVTGSQNIRVYSASSGQNLHTILLQDNKPLSVAFVPTWNPLEEERYIWVGLEKGDLMEMDIKEGRILTRRSIHSSSVLYILKFRETSLVTIDEQGALKIWTETDTRGVLNLNARPRGLRVNPKLSVGRIHGDHLWLGSNRNLEVYNLAPEAPIVLLKKLDWGTHIGNVSTLTSGQSHDSLHFYTGHEGEEESLSLMFYDMKLQKLKTSGVDGKILEWDGSTYERKRIFQTGIYRVTSLFTCLPHILWAGFSTGKINILDLSHPDNPLVLKDFQAHVNTGVMDFVLDQKSVFLGGQYWVLSLSEQGEIRVWDALLLQDWIGNLPFF